MREPETASAQSATPALRANTTEKYAAALKMRRVSYAEIVAKGSSGLLVAMGAHSTEHANVAVAVNTNSKWADVNFMAIKTMSAKTARLVLSEVSRSPDRVLTMQTLSVHAAKRASTESSRQEAVTVKSTLNVPRAHPVMSTSSTPLAA